jgi:hypothetical protein
MIEEKNVNNLHGTYATQLPNIGRHQASSYNVVFTAIKITHPHTRARLTHPFNPHVTLRFSPSLFATKNCLYRGIISRRLELGELGRALKYALHERPKQRLYRWICVRFSEFW